MSALSGWRTYIIAAAGVIATGLHGMGYISDTVYTTIMGILGSGAAATIHAAVTNSKS